jgi:REP element-mobilizing transposase RayT
MPRVKLDGCAYYHVMSRIIEGRMLMNDVEKERAMKLLGKVAGFSGVELLTFAILDNHLHIELLVPERPEIDDEEFLRRLRCLYPALLVKRKRTELHALRQEGAHAAAERLKRAYTYRMNDLSEFMKTLMQRLTMSYNRRHERKGPLWEDRFKSVLLEGKRSILTTVAAYIDLNAVRAGLVRDPKDYRFCGYGAAMGGTTWARRGVNRVVRAMDHPVGNWEETQAAYRKLLFVSGEETGLDEQGNPARPGLKPNQVLQVLRDGGKVKKEELLGCRVRYLTDTMVLGSRIFVEDIVRRNRRCFGAKRIRVTSTLPSLEGFHVPRDLCGPVIVAPHAA